MRAPAGAWFAAPEPLPLRLRPGVIALAARIRVVIRLALAAAAIATALGPAMAASPEEAYLASRDAYVAKFKGLDDANKIDDVAMKAHDQAIADLERQMRAIIGGVAIKGLPKPGVANSGKLNLGTLFPSDQGYGTLDGLVFASADDKTRVIVTTATMFATWLRLHQDWWGEKTPNVPQDVTAALASEAFYTQAIQTDAAVMKFAQLPLAPPAGATVAFAMLAARSQDQAPPVPDEIFVTVMRGGRLYVANAPVGRKFAAVAACTEVRRRQEKAADAALAAYTAGKSKDEKLLDRSTALREEADAVFLRCFAKEAARQPAFAAAVKQAQGLLDSLPSP